MGWQLAQVSGTLALVLGLITVPAVEALPAPAADGLVIATAPTSVQLDPGDTVSAGLIISNNSTSALVVTGVEVLGSVRAGVEVTDLELPTSIAANTSTRATLRLTAGPGVQDQELAVIVSYGPAGAPQRTVSTSLSLKAGQAESAPTVTMHGLPPSLNDGEQRAATIEVANQTPFTFRDVTVGSLAAGDAAIEQVDSSVTGPWAACPSNSSAPGRAIACLDMLSPGEVRLLDVAVQAAERVRTGNHRLGVVVTAERVVMAERAADDSTGALPPVTVLATGEIDLRVFGVDALSPFGIGVLFVLPGLVALLVFLLLTRWLYPRTAEVPDSVAITDLRAMPIVVPIAAGIYLLVWAILGRDLTRSLGTLDVALLFGLGLLIGFGMWAAMAVVYYRRYGRKQFDVGDDPRTVLRRLRDRQQAIVLPRFDANGVRYLELDRPADDKVLASPQIAYSFTERMAQGARSALHQAVTDNDLTTILKVSKAGGIRLTWKAAAGLRTFDAASVQSPTADPILVEVQPP